MTPFKFEQLSTSIQSCFLWSEGDHICSIIKDGQLIKLYTIYGFFVEVYFSEESDDIEEIAIIKTEEQFNTYLEIIDLPQDI